MINAELFEILIKIIEKDCKAKLSNKAVKKIAIFLVSYVKVLKKIKT
jgi:hypothetical protein